MERGIEGIERSILAFLCWEFQEIWIIVFTVRNQWNIQRITILKCIKNRGASGGRGNPRFANGLGAWSGKGFVQPNNEYQSDDENITSYIILRRISDRKGFGGSQDESTDVSEYSSLIFVLDHAFDVLILNSDK